MADLEVFVPCDRCRARAREVWTKADWLLTFCGHHGDKFAMALIAQGFDPVRQEVTA